MSKHICNKKRYLRIVVTMMFLAISVHNVAAESPGLYRLGFTGMLKCSVKGDGGMDLGAIYNNWGFRLGFMADFNRLDSDRSNVVGRHYRLSYTGGAAYRVCDWMRCGLSAGYGEYGTYGYNCELDQYGIAGKIRGVEVGAQLQFIICEWIMLEVGYNTIPVGFSKGRPFHDISLGVGFSLDTDYF